MLQARTRNFGSGLGFRPCFGFGHALDEGVDEFELVVRESDAHSCAGVHRDVKTHGGAERGEGAHRLSMLRRAQTLSAAPCAPLLHGAWGQGRGKHAAGAAPM